MKTPILLLILLFSAAYADSEKPDENSKPSIETSPATEVSANLITDEQAEELGLERGDSYDVVSQESIEDLFDKVDKKLRKEGIDHYSMEINESNKPKEYRASITEYFNSEE